MTTMKLNILGYLVSLVLKSRISVALRRETYQLAVVEIALTGALMESGVVSAGTSHIRSHALHPAISSIGHHLSPDVQEVSDTSVLLHPVSSHS